MTRPPPLVIGHRGAPGYRPEHSRSSYELALAMGADAVEPDVVVSRDGVLVVRHENEIAATTDVSRHPRFADRRTTRTIDGARLTGWFAEDFTADELATLRCRERLPRLRPASAAFDDTEPVLRLRDVLDLVRDAARRSVRAPGVVLEIKHATYFAGLGHDLARLVDEEVRAAGWDDGALPLVIESFEPTVLARLRARGLRAEYVALIEGEGSPADLVARDGAAAPTYAAMASPAGLDALAGAVDGVSVPKGMVLDAPAGGGVVADAHARGLRAYTWTCRPENAFLSLAFRGRGGPAAFGDWEGEWALVRRSGVDGVFVDHADLGAFFRADPLA